MYDLMQFIDSPDIREYNKETQFTPAEWAVLVSKSLGKTVEEKIEALQYLVDHYGADEFKEETVWPEFGDFGYLYSFREVVAETIRAWRMALENRFETEGVVFRANLFEQEYGEQGEHWGCFSDYEKAWTYLLERKQEYLDDEELKDVKTYAKLERIRLDQDEGQEGELYLFDNKMRLIDVFIDETKFFAGKKEIALASDYSAYVPLPFKAGDIVKVDFPQTKVHYGVFPGDWKRPEDPGRIHMWASLEMYIAEREDFDFTDNCPYYDWILGFSFCSDEELPEDVQALKLVRAVRKGEMDFYTLLHKFGRGELNTLLR